MRLYIFCAGRHDRSLAHRSCEVSKTKSDPVQPFSRDCGHLYRHDTDRILGLGGWTVACAPDLYFIGCGKPRKIPSRRKFMTAALSRRGPRPSRAPHRAALESALRKCASLCILYAAPPAGPRGRKGTHVTRPMARAESANKSANRTDTTAGGGVGGNRGRDPCCVRALRRSGAR